MKKYLTLILISSLFLSACGAKKTTNTPTPVPTPRVVEIETKDRPEIFLTPRSDGHELYLKMNSISSIFSSIEYELTYLAVDGGLEIEKGVSGIVEPTDIASGKIDRKLLLGTESCTSGCKYKYDTGVSSGTLTITFTTKNNQVSTFTSPFILKSTADIKKTGKLLWPEENYSYTPKTKLSGSNYFIVIKDYKNGGYSVTSSGSL